VPGILGWGSSERFVLGSDAADDVSYGGNITGDIIPDDRS